MADELPDAPWATDGDLPDAPWAVKASTAAPSLDEALTSGGQRAANTIVDAFRPSKRAERSTLENIGATGKAIANVPVLAAEATLVPGAIRYLGGHGIKGLTDAATAGLQSVFGGKREEMPLEDAANQAETAIGAVGARLPKVTPTPAMPQPRGPLGVELSEGQAARNLDALQLEEQARKQQLGPKAAEQAQAFDAQQAEQVAAARQKVSESFDPYGQQIAESPYDAGELVSNTLQKQAAEAKAGVKQAYDQANDMPGTIPPEAFDNVGATIRSELENSPKPVLIDDRLTPFADRAIKDVESQVAKLQEQTAQIESGPDDPQVLGMSLKGVEQLRKRLSALRNGAWSNNREDGRAASAVVDAFDDFVSKAINSGKFNGDPRAIKAWEAARAAHSDYKRTFSGGSKDPVGRVVEKIIGRDTKGPEIPERVADHIYGATGVNPSSLNVAVAKKIKGIIGEASPEWSSVRQGLFERVADPAHGPTKIVKNIDHLLDGRAQDLGRAIYTPDQLSILKEFRDLNEALIKPKGSFNPSETSTFLARIIGKIGGQIGPLFGAVAARTILPALPPLVSEALGAGATKLTGALGQHAQARKIARQMPIVRQQMENWQRAVAKANRTNSPASAPAVAFATTNLAKSLRPLGIEFQQVLQQISEMPSPISGTDESVASDRPQRAHGGRVEFKNINPNPTEGQKAAGNYAKDHVTVHGLNIAIENAKGMIRRGVDKNGKKWSCRLSANYGYVKGTEGADGDHLDVYLGPYIKSPRAYVVDQVDADTGKFDEHKIMLGFSSRKQAQRCYMQAFSDDKGADRIGAMVEMSVPELKNWIKRGKTDAPIAAG